MKQKITTFLWMAGHAEEAAKFYTSLFADSRIVSSNPMSTLFELAGQQYLALNQGPSPAFSDATSLFVSCADQAEVDRTWDAFIAHGGTPTACGWLRDKYGLAWQIIPTALMRLMGDPDPVKAQRVQKAILGMVKIDVAELERAHAGS
jgi:predicted 3-demethylubiquinone-9 3-methyltransferase (glyoxalase superfamily)